LNNSLIIKAYNKKTKTPDKSFFFVCDKNKHEYHLNMNFVKIDEEKKQHVDFDQNILNILESK
jgi:hypothetical protein